MAQARDEAGNIWEVDAQGNAIRLVHPAGPSPLTIGSPNPKTAYEAPKAAADLERVNIQNEQDRATMEAGRRKAIADARAAELQAKKLEKELGAAAKKGGNGALDAIVTQINDVAGQFAAGPGSTTGIKGLRDFIPSSFSGQNAAFDAAAAGLEDQAAMAFRVPGSGTVSDADAARIARANKPDRWNPDAANLQRFKQLRVRVDAARAAAGLPPAQWNIPGQTPTSDSNRGSIGGIPNTSPPAGPSGPGSTPSSGGSGGGPRMALATGGVRNELDPGLSSRLEQLVRSGASADEIRRQLPGVEPDQASITAVQSYLKAHPEYSGFAPVTRQVQNGLLSQVAASPVGAFISSAADAVIPMKSLVDAKQGAAFDQLKAENPTSSLLGTLAGGIPAAAGLEFGLARAAPGLGRFAPAAADALYGGIQGAGNAQEGEGALGAIEGAGAGLIGGVIGRGVARGVGRAASGIQNEAVDYLRSNGVRGLTAGQALGGTAKQIEDQATGLPFIGGIINRRRGEGMEQFNQAAFDQALAPIGETTGGVIGAPGIDLARAARSRGYSNALDGVNVQADAPFVSDMQGALQAGRALPDPMSANADYTLNTRVGNSFGPNGELTGNDYQQSVRGLRRDAKAVASQPYGYDFGQVTNQAEDALNGILGRQAPDVVPAVGRANEANKLVETLRTAVNSARNGTRTGESDVFAPSQLADAAAATARKFGNSAGTTNQPFFDLTRAGQEVLPSRVGDSGTAGRYILGSALGGGAAATGGFLGSGEDGPSVAGTGGGSLAGLAGLGAVAALGGSRAGQQSILRLLADRPDLIRSLGGRIQNRSGVIGAGGVPLAITLQNALTGF